MLSTTRVQLLEVESLNKNKITKLCIFHRLHKYSFLQGQLEKLPFLIAEKVTLRRNEPHYSLPPVRDLDRDRNSREIHIEREKHVESRDKLFEPREQVEHRERERRNEDVSSDLRDSAESTRSDFHQLRKTSPPRRRQQSAPSSNTLTQYPPSQGSMSQI